MASVAVLGLGRMGTAMAVRLSAEGHEVHGWNRSAAKGEALGAAVTVASAPAAAVDGCDVVIAMLANGQVTQDILLAQETLDALSPDVVVADMGTSGVATARALDDVLTARGVRFVDAPVSGSVPTVAAGQLLVMASGSAAGVDAARPVFLSMAKEVSFLGRAGNGQSMKLAVNLVVHALNSAVSEALALAVKSGIDAGEAYRVFEESVVGAPFVRYKRAAFLEPSTPVAMSLSLVLKDLTLIRERADELGLRAEVLSAVASEIARACDEGRGSEDMAALARVLLADDGS
jgi:3-hydroxyisobutyrate dehydrogenase-like beta-hydroxyacid dehydrogenase